MAVSIFKLPPGHRQIIEAFVKEVKQLEDKKRLPKKRVSEASCALPKKLPKAKETPVNSESSSNSRRSADFAPRNQASTVGYIRQQIVKWQRMQKEIKLRELKELEHYEVNGKPKEVGDDFVASILCKVCNKSCALGQKEGRMMISNWTKHVNKCIQTSKCHVGVTMTIHQYLQATEPPTCHSLPILVLQSQLFLQLPILLLLLCKSPTQLWRTYSIFSISLPHKRKGNEFLF